MNKHTVIVAVACLAAGTGFGLWLAGRPPHPPAAPSPSAEAARSGDRPPLAAPVPPGAGPDLRALAGRLGGGGALSPAQQADDRRVEAEQVADALRELASARPEDRLGAVQQLGAYPNAQAERKLAEVLTRDPAPEVRAAAAQSLALVNGPTGRSIDALLAALRHPEAGVREAALDTLQGYASRLAADSAGFKRVLRGLEELARSNALDRNTREELKDWLRDFAG
jgi:hypothetical protein